MKQKKPFAGYWHYGVILTFLSAAAGVAAICLSLCINPVWGLICIFVSGVCDSLDGIVAGTRKNRTADDKRFGSRIDMLADVIAFGLAPVAVGYGAGMHGWYFIVLFCAYILSSIIRLAYFEVTEDIRLEKGAEKRRYYEGLPLAAIVPALPVFYLTATIFDGFVCNLILAVPYAVCTVLFILRFKFPKFGKKSLLITLLLIIVIIAVLVVLRYLVFNKPILIT